MKDFEYAEPRTEAEVLELLSSEAGHTEILAGGTDLVPLMKKMVVAPDRVVNIMEVASLGQIELLPAGGLRIGAAVRLEDLLSHPYMDDYPAVGQAIRGINSMQLQAQGTIGGEICQRPQCWFYRNGYGLLAGSRAAAEGDDRFHAIFGNSGPAKFVGGSRTAPALVALDALVRVVGPKAEQEQLVPLDSFYRTPRRDRDRENMLAPNQLVTHVILPPAMGRTSATYEVRHGEGPDYPLAAAAAALSIEGGVVRDARIVLGQVAPTPWLSEEAAAALLGKPVTELAAAAAGEAATARATPLANNEYKVDLARVAVKRAVLLAAGLETGGF